METVSQKRFVVNPSLKLPPQDITAEMAVLGSLMLRPEGFYEIVDLLTPEDFYAEKHRLIYKAMQKLHEKREPIDAVSLSSALAETGALEAIGGASYLAELINLVPTSSNLPHYAEIVRRKAALRKLILSSEEIMGLGYREDEDISTVLDKAEKIIFGLANFSKRTFTALKDTLAEAWERFEKLNSSDGGLRGVPTGFKPLDNKLSGLQKADLIILAARPSVGKTSLALDIARNAAKHGIPVGIFSLEMSTQQLVDRLIAAESRVDSWKLRTGQIRSDEEFERIQGALDTLSRAAPILIDDEPGCTIVKMRSAARRLKAEHNVGLIVVDYLQLMTPQTSSDSMVQQVTEISRSLKGLARELEVPVLALSQLNRAVEARGGRPRLSDLRDSGSIEQDADVVMFIHREDKQNENSERKNIAEILIEKHRNGPVGRIELYFDDKHTSFVELEKSDFGSF